MRPHAFEAMPGPNRTALHRRCCICKQGPGHSIHLYELPGIKKAVAFSPEGPARIDIEDRYEVPANQLDLFAG